MPKPMLTTCHIEEEEVFKGWWMLNTTLRISGKMDTSASSKIAYASCFTHVLDWTQEDGTIAVSLDENFWSRQKEKFKWKEQWLLSRDLTWLK